MAEQRHPVPSFPTMKISFVSSSLPFPRFFTTGHLNSRFVAAETTIVSDGQSHYQAVVVAALGYFL
ncbi:hypothetical protein HanXRQr2_Chr01g0006141 [Helianthus annuus]|uniref:Uncharacterized protein n=1 Tax=Helianthus annuus TaxID=4232 RepID=A0A9K3JT48_HELAN|nr:hypothetical protein HanXRQr2_Chr01g0006141 [Helianthus annuus]KAJ0621276.1 hypothetical protein HanIR_Chr01g0006841 [Helianthus annuus]KAJ0955703.1 hypothetical protein HanPSC8_Chr01g0005931 [Helianthus annuus]